MRWFCALAVLAFSVGDALAETDAERAAKALAAIESGPPGQRAAAIAELDKAAPRAVAELGQFLQRPHKSLVADRRATLQLIEATVPDDKGNFIAPPRQAAAQVKKDDELDWIAALSALPPETPGVGEIIADVSVLRALGGTKDVAAATIVLDAAFAAETMVYRDECGRQLRRLAPYSLPALIRGSQVSLKEAAKRRYSTYQLERLDRQDAAKALAGAGQDENLRIAVLDAFRDTKHREAVYAVLDTVNDDAPRVRAAARTAWLAYVTGKAPPPAPKKKLQLPGGKQTDEEMPLWMTYRELATIRLKGLAGELLSEEYGEKERVNLEELSQRIFAHYDQKRAEGDAAVLVAAKAKADGGDLAGAVRELAPLVAADVEHLQRAEIAAIYFAYAKSLEKEEKWNDAAAAYSTAHGLDPKGATAQDALAAHHYAMGRSLVASGKDGGPAFRRALELKPEYEVAEKAAEAASGGGQTWLLYLAGAVAAAGVGLLALAMSRRKAA